MRKPKGYDPLKVPMFPKRFDFRSEIDRTTAGKWGWLGVREPHPYKNLAKQYALMSLGKRTTTSRSR